MRWLVAMLFISVVWCFGDSQTQLFRSHNVGNYCGNSSRNYSAVESIERNLAEDVQKFFTHTTSSDGTKLLHSLLADGNTFYSDVLREAWVGTLPWFLTLLALLGLLCAVAFKVVFYVFLSSKHELNKKCRCLFKSCECFKSHSKWGWVGWLGFILFLLIETVGFVGISIVTSESIVRSGKLSACAAARTLDDILNGASNQNSFYTGTNLTLQNFAELIQSTIPEINTSASLLDISTLILRDPGAALLGQLEMLANSTTPNNSFVLTYTNPTPGVLDRTVQSSFGAELGNPTIPSSLIGSLYSNVTGIISTLNNLSSSMNASTLLSRSIQSLQSSTYTLNDYLSRVDRNFPVLVRMVEQFDLEFSKLLMVYWGMVLLNSTLFVVVVVLHCKSYCENRIRQSTTNAKNQLSNDEERAQEKGWIARLKANMVRASTAMSYLTLLCNSVFLIGLSAFLLLLMTGIALACTGAQNILQSPSTFQKFLIDENLQAHAASILRQCVPDGTNTTYGNSTQFRQLKQYVNELNTSLNIAKLALDQFSMLGSAESDIDRSLNSYLTAEYNDILADQESVQWFNMLSQKITPACSKNATLVDSLVPSTQLTSLEKFWCYPGTMTVDCADFATCPSGCISLYQVMSSSTNLSDFQQKIRSRYAANPQCAANLSDQLTVNYNNWYLPRTDNSTGIGSVRSRWKAGSSIMLSSISANLSQLTSNVYPTFVMIDQLVDPTTGLIPSLDCSVIAQDLHQLKDTLCVNIFYSTFLMFLFVFATLILTLPQFIVFRLLHLSKRPARANPPPIAREVDIIEPSSIICLAEYSVLPVGSTRSSEVEDGPISIPKFPRRPISQLLGILKRRKLRERDQFVSKKLSVY